jgi:hypothetical protein
VVAVEYNNYMGGVDLWDQRRRAFSFGSGSRMHKWWKQAWVFVLDAALTNSWTIYNAIHGHTAGSKDAKYETYLEKLSSALVKKWVTQSPDVRKRRAKRRRINLNYNDALVSVSDVVNSEQGNSSRAAATHLPINVDRDSNGKPKYLNCKYCYHTYNHLQSKCAVKCSCCGIALHIWAGATTHMGVAVPERNCFQLFHVNVIDPFQPMMSASPPFAASVNTGNSNINLPAFGHMHGVPVQPPDDHDVDVDVDLGLQLPGQVGDQHVIEDPDSG